MVPRMVAITPGDALDPATFSGTTRRLLQALERRGALAAAVDGRPEALALVEKAAAFDRDGERWRHFYNAGATPVSPLIRAGMSRVASARANRAAAASGADAFLQVTGWYVPRPAPPPGAAPLVRASYHDGNLATFLTRPDLKIDRSSRRVRRALAYERGLYDQLDVILTMSEWLRRSFVEDFGQPEEKVVAVGAGPNFDDVPEAPGPRDWSVPRLLFVGKQWERKGGPEVLAGFAALRAEHPEATLTIVGTTLPGPTPPGVEVVGLLDRTDPAQNARFEAALRTATAFVMPSRYEPFGIAFLEAMAFAVPCVGSDSCAMPEIIADGVTGAVVPAGDGEALGAALLALAVDPDGARRMGEAARERLLERFTWDAVAGRTVQAVGARLERRAPLPTTQA